VSGPDPFELLRQLVAIPSPSGTEARLAAFVLAWARSHGLDAEPVGRNVVVRAGRRGGPRLLYNSHLDTVAPVADWPHDPFTPRVDGDRLSGLGANDAKGCVAAMLCAVVALSRRPVGGEVVLALTVDEEVGGGEGLQAIVHDLEPFAAAVIGEPTGLDLCCAQKGLLILEVETSGVARHAAHAHRLPGANAVVEAAHAIARLEGLTPGPSDPLLGPTTCHVTTISGGSRRNVIPDRCVFTLDVRTVTADATEEVVAVVHRVSGGEVRVLSDRLKPVSTDPSAAIVQAALRVRPEAKVVGSATLSDAVWTRHRPTVKVGPGQSERSHTAGEYVTREELEAGVAFFRRLAAELFKAGPGGE